MLLPSPVLQEATDNLVKLTQARQGHSRFTLVHPTGGSNFITLKLPNFGYLELQNP